jgi:hypothetical protein
MYRFQIRNLGTLRSALLSDSRVVGLYITERNVRNLLQLAGGINQSPKNSQRAAREVLNFITQGDDILLLSQGDLNSLEETWTGRVRFEDDAASSSLTATFYVLIEYATFINNSWDIVREITYLAVAKAAFDVLIKYADFKKAHEGTQSISQNVRSCNHHILSESINCLRSGSPSQTLLAALPCTSLALISLPKRMRADHTLLTETLGFEYLGRPRLRELVSKFHKFAQKRPVRKTPRLVRTSDGGIAVSLPRPDVRPDETSFVRTSERRDNISVGEHHQETLCDRCRRDNSQTNYKCHFTRRNDAIFSAYGMVLVESLHLKGVTPHRHDICLFAQELCLEASDEIALSVIVEDLLQSGNIYHTIRHPLSPEFARSCPYARDTLWNFPRPCRPPTDKQERDISDWLKELRGQIIPPVEKNAQNHENQWDSLQVLLFCLGEGKTWESAKRTLSRIRLGRQDRRELYRKKDSEVFNRNGVFSPSGPPRI